MSDIVERLRTAASNNRIQAGRGTTTTGEILTALGCQTKETVAEMHDEAADEITRLRSLLKEARDALAVSEAANRLGLSAFETGFAIDWDELELAADQSATVLSKIKGEA